MTTLTPDLRRAHTGAGKEGCKATGCGGAAGGAAGKSSFPGPALQVREAAAAQGCAGPSCATFIMLFMFPGAGNSQKLHNLLLMNLLHSTLHGMHQGRRFDCC